MKRFRLKADGRIVELRDGKEFPLAPDMDAGAATPGVREETASGLVMAGAAAAFAGLVSFGNQIEAEARRVLSF